MIAVSPQQKIYVSLDPLDFRKGFNGTVGACRKLAQESHLTGAVFMFINKNKTMVRCYFFDGHGEYILTKRASQGRFKWWTKNPERVDPSEIIAVLAGNGPLSDLPEAWKKIN